MDRPVDRRQFLVGAAAFTAAGAVPGLSRADAVAARRRRAQADMVVMGGRVLTMDARFSTAQAVALRQGKVLAVGSTKEIRRLAGRRTEVLDAKGCTVLPGINDSHLHASAFSLSLPPITIDVDKATAAEMVDAVRAAASAAGPGESWLRGTGWNDNRLDRVPTRHDLDAVSGEHPVTLGSFDGHAVLVNSKVLQLAGVTRDTAPPPGGVIEKDAAGEPTGVLREGAAGLVRRVTPPFTEEEVRQGLVNGFELLHAMGVTSITEPGTNLDTLGLMASMAREGTLGSRMTVLLSAGSSLASLQRVLDDYRPLRGVDERRLRVAGVKIFADGIPTAAQTAWLKEPYVDGRNGALTVDGASTREQLDTLGRMIAAVHRVGMQIGTHATGDATIDAVVASYLRAMRAHRRRDPRHYVIHGDLTPPATLRAMAKHGIGVNMNATIKYLLGRSLDGVLGPERTSYQWPYRTALDAGVKVSSASDAPVTYPDWRQGVSSAVLRRGQFGGGVAGAAERISLREALRTYTSTPAWQDRAEDWKGTLTRGAVADLCVVEGDVLDGPPAKLTELPVAATVLAGKVVYERKRSRRATAARAATGRFSRRDRAAACLNGGGCCCTLTEAIRAGHV